jgi:8-oxo-dGTP pyrophosphatase MutT (NUDIX family)
MIKSKAGLIPYFVEEDGEVKYMFMIPSRKSFGERYPAIAKGGVEQGETILEAALREASEELGLKKSNIDFSTLDKLFEGHMMGRIRTHHLTVYIVRVLSKTDFDETVDETFKTVWLTSDGFKKIGLDTHKFIVQVARDKIEAK